MSATIPIVPTRRHLVFDEVEDFRCSDGRVASFRIRVWRAKDSTPLVLVRQTAGRRTEFYPSERIANWVYQAVLRCHEWGMMYYEAYRAHDGWHVAKVMFEYAGHAERLHYYSPLSQTSNIGTVAMLAGEPVEL
jgi:hypothetical protein